MYWLSLSNNLAQFKMTPRISYPTISSDMPCIDSVAYGALFRCSPIAL